MANKTLFITALHGDEGFGVEILQKIEKDYPREKYNYDWIIGNPEAYKQNVRFTKEDLNRVAPGNINSDIYEQKRAAEIIDLSKNYSCIVDIHGTNAKSGIFTLIPNPKIENLLLASMLPIKNNVIWAAKVSLEKGPVTQYTQCPAVEIECGPKTSPEIQADLEKIIAKILENSNSGLNSLNENTKDKVFYQVYGSIENADTSNMNEFEETEFNGEKFYPLLINSYKSGSARKMKKVDFFETLGY